MKKREKRRREIANRDVSRKFNNTVKIFHIK